MYNYRSAFQNREAHCFHVLGFDILLDADCKPWLLEINANPSLNIEHEVLGRDGKPIVEESPLDEYVKAQVVEDAIALAVRAPHKQLAIGVGGRYHSYTMVIGGESASDEQLLVDNMLRVYGWLSGYRFREALTSGRFAKLATLPGMTTATVTKADYDILFKKVLVREFG